ncbi:MAG: hypothetical protein JSR82_24735 [Verrucomicrobia bacterium]|nr:hypothetical protein [Verrucomicrobiota bacterium]
MLGLLEALPAVLFGIFTLLLEVTYLCVNLGLAGLELILHLFFENVALPRLTTSRQQALREGRAPEHPLPTWQQTAASLLLVAAAIGLTQEPHAWRALTTRTVTIVSPAGGGIPLARVYVQDSEGERPARTNLHGQVSYPRWSTTGLRLEDFRYQPRTWTKPQLGPVLEAQPNLLTQHSRRAWEWLRQRRDRR